MHQPFDKFLMFQNRLQKVLKHFGKQARRQGVTCYRLYDHDLPEFPFIIEVYENKVYVAEYKRRHHMSDEEHETWLLQCRKLIAEALHVPEEDIFVKIRRRKEGRQGQYQKVDEARVELEVKENGLRFIVNLSDYLDTGLFLDHRLTRQMVRDQSKDSSVLNLFSYTGSFSVYAVAGHASRVVSVDLSKTYLAWGDRNMRLNFPGQTNHQSVHADVKQYLKGTASGHFDLIIMDPPTFSNSKRMDDILDIQKDHVELINHCMDRLKAGGILFFSTNYTQFKLDVDALIAKEIKDITRQTTPFDFEGRLKRQCFRIVK